MAPSADHLDTAYTFIVGAGQSVNPPFTDADSNALGQLGATGEEWTRPHSNLWADAFRRLIRNRLALIGLIIVCGFVLMAILGADSGSVWAERVVDVRLARMGPSWNWPMGLDKNKRPRYLQPADVGFARFLVGWTGVLRCHLVDCAAIRLDRRVLTVGPPRRSSMRIVDVIYTIPQVLLVMLFVNARCLSLTNIILGIEGRGVTSEELREPAALAEVAPPCARSTSSATPARPASTPSAIVETSRRPRSSAGRRCPTPTRRPTRARPRSRRR